MIAQSDTDISCDLCRGCQSEYNISPVSVCVYIIIYKGDCIFKYFTLVESNLQVLSIFVEKCCNATWGSVQEKTLREGDLISFRLLDSR